MRAARRCQPVGREAPAGQPSNRPSITAPFLGSPAAMQTVRLGRTNAEVSVAGLGCGGPSKLGMARGADVHHAAGVARRALDLGVSFIDTAGIYGTEEAVGEGIAGRRAQVFLSTKATPRSADDAALITAAELTE